MKIGTSLNHALSWTWHAQKPEPKNNNVILSDLPSVEGILGSQLGKPWRCPPWCEKRCDHYRPVEVGISWFSGMLHEIIVPEHYNKEVNIQSITVAMLIKIDSCTIPCCIVNVAISRFRFHFWDLIFALDISATPPLWDRQMTEKMKCDQRFARFRFITG